MPAFLALLHGAFLLAVPLWSVVALGSWWNANTVSHTFVHGHWGRRAPAVWSAYLSALLGLPQELWRQKHLAHHTGRPLRVRCTARLWVDGVAALSVWGVLAWRSPSFLLGQYLPGFALGQVLCAVHGFYEHRAGTTSCYGRIYNRLFLNDGYHLEHHRAPHTSWRNLPALRTAGTRQSRLPPVLRWLEGDWLDLLERPALHSARLRQFLLARHRAALQRLLPALGEVRRAAVIGGGLFPRTAILLHELLPNAEITIIDGCRRHLRQALRFLPRDRVRLRQAWFDGRPLPEVDLVVLPLALRGGREQVYAAPPCARVLVHDWIWNARGRSAVVSPWLLKRLNLVNGVRA